MWKSWIKNIGFIAVSMGVAEIGQQKAYQNVEKIRWKEVRDVTATGTFWVGPSCCLWHMHLNPNYFSYNLFGKICSTVTFFQPVIMFGFFAITGKLKDAEKWLENAGDKLIYTYPIAAAFWTPVIFGVVQFLPLKFHVACYTVVGFVWNNILCYVKNQPNEPIREVPDEKHILIEDMRKMSEERASGSKS